MHVVHLLEGPYLPDIVGGVGRTLDPECRLMIASGHTTTVIALLSASRVRRFVRRALTALRVPRGLVRFLGRLMSMRHRYLGYDVHRVPQFVFALALEETIEELRPDIVILESRSNTMLHAIATLQRRGIPVVGRLWSQVPLPPVPLADVPYFTMSASTAAYYRGLGVPAPIVLPPLIVADAYRVEAVGRSVVSIGAVREKGFDLMLDIAALCPEIPFEVYATWGARPDDLMARAGALPNLRVHETVDDMREVYARARVVAAPSRMETWGRTVTEAQISGIPVIARDVGALAEAVDGGGILMAVDADAAAWAAQLRRLWTDEALYADLSRRALASANRPELAPETIVRRLIDVLRAEIVRQNPGVASTAERGDRVGQLAE